MTANAQHYAPADSKAQTQHFFYYPALKMFTLHALCPVISKSINSDRTACHQSLQRLQSTTFLVLLGNF